MCVRVCDYRQGLPNSQLWLRRDWIRSYNAFIVNITRKCDIDTRLVRMIIIILMGMIHPSLFGLLLVSL